MSSALHQDVQLDQDGEGVFARKGLLVGREERKMSGTLRLLLGFCICCCFS